MTSDQPILSLNAGEISRLALARIDLAKLRTACELQRNFLPHVLGGTMLRPGTEHVANILNDRDAWLGEFYYSETEKTLLVLTADGMRFFVNGFYIGRVAVSAVVTNGTFPGGSLTGWTQSDESGALSDSDGAWLRLTGTGSNYAWRDQEVTVAEAGREHALRIILPRGPVAVKIGASLGDGTYFAATLAPGTYSLAFTPSGNFWIRLGADRTYPCFVQSVAVEGPDIVTLPAPWTTKAQFDTLRYDQSGDVLFVCGGGVQQRRIERRTANSRSWGIALYQSDDGPFRLGNQTSTQLTVTGSDGNVTMTASRPIFQPGHVGALFRLTHSFQTESATVAGANQFTAPIRVGGLSSHSGSISSRNFSISVASGIVGTVTLQRSFVEPGAWADVLTLSAGSEQTYDDALDNQIVFYRAGVKSGGYTSGSAEVTLRYGGASQDGVVRVTTWLSETSVLADVLAQIGGVSTWTDDWAEGEWSDLRGWPNEVVFHDGRLAWFPSIKAQLSVSDGYDSFDPNVTGDSGPINRVIATGGADGVRWALSLSRLILGTAAQNITIKSSSFDEPLSPTAFSAKVCGSDGAAAGVRAVRTGQSGVFIGAADRIFSVAYDVQIQDYSVTPIDRLKPEMAAAGVASLAVSHRPDNANVWPVLKDGTAVLVVQDPAEEVHAMVSLDTPGAFERAAVLPGKAEDDVYFVVARTIGGVTKRFLERLAKRTDAQGGLLNTAGLDSHVRYAGAPTTVIAAPHLAGQQVGVWADGQALPPMTLDGAGNATLAAPVSHYVVGLSVRGRIKSAKLAYAAGHGTSLTAKKRVSRLGLVLADTSWSGLRIGRDFGHMTHLPATYKGRRLQPGAVLPSYDTMVPFNGGWDEDARVCIEIAGPHSCHIMGLALHWDANEPVEPPPPAPRNG